MTIQNFRKIRRDGKIIDDSMTIDEIFSWGTPEKIIELRWDNNNQPTSLKSIHGVLAKIVSGGEYIAAKIHNDDSGRNSTLWIINADGSMRLQIPNDHSINGKNVSGDFGWLEKSRTQQPNIFGVIFECRDKNLMFQLDIDAANGNVIGIYPAR
ncbi:MAG: hypothetical protein WCC64_18775 [Aliidongia sp.]